MAKKRKRRSGRGSCGCPAGTTRVSTAPKGAKRRAVLARGGTGKPRGGGSVCIARVKNPMGGASLTRFVKHKSC